MRKSFDKVEKYRVNLEGMPETHRGQTFGMFIIARPTIQIRMLACDGSETGWDHVSVSCKVQKPDGTKEDICAPWDIMKMAKEFFWEDEECVVQFHPPASRYINRTENVLHLWKRVGQEYETPPTILI